VHDTIHKFQPDKSVMAEHCTGVQHNTNFKATTILCVVRGYRDCLLRDAADVPTTSTGMWTSLLSQVLEPINILQ
jgi:hypothetical protein